jgi:hypothetical protein
MNRVEKLRRSAMSIAANAPASFSKLRGSGMFVRPFMERLNPSSARTKEPADVDCHKNDIFRSSMQAKTLAQGATIA